MYRFHQIFCATAWELEGERRAFYDLVGEVNEADSMPRGALYVPVSLTNVQDKRPLQYTVDENIRACSYYLLAIAGDWGSKERNFERDYRLALSCRADPSLPMRETAILLQARPDGAPDPFAAELAAAGFPSIPFRDTTEFNEIVRALLKQWIAAEEATSNSGAPA